jgi:hypothetical protein
MNETPGARRSIVQNAWVVSNLHEAIKQWLSMGVGPFLTSTNRFPNAIYRGQRVPLEFSSALAQAGGVQIELIEQHSTGPSAFRDVIPAGHTGFHHIWMAVPDWDQEVISLQSRGIVLATEAEAGDVRFCYADTRGTLGCMVELLEDAPVVRQLLATVALAARDWDGSDPIRPLG